VSDIRVVGSVSRREESFMEITTSAENNRDRSSEIFLGTIGNGWNVVTFLKQQTIFRQGDAADTVFYVLEGTVRHTVVSRFGKEAILGILSEGKFFGDGGLADEPLRKGSTTAITDCKLLEIGKDEMMLALHRERALSDMFIAHLLARNIRYHEDLVNHLFDSSEMRLARALLLLAHFDKEGLPETVIPRISQEALADMAGTTHLCVRLLMERFKSQGFLSYCRSGMRIDSSLLNVILHN
jgi:CRP-like cAMP-binding protein